MEILSQIYYLVNIDFLLSKIEILSKNQNFVQKSKCCPKINNFVKINFLSKTNICETSKFFIKNRIFRLKMWLTRSQNLKLWPKWNRCLHCWPWGWLVTIWNATGDNKTGMRSDWFRPRRRLFYEFISQRISIQRLSYNLWLIEL